MAKATPQVAKQKNAPAHEANKPAVNSPTNLASATASADSAGKTANTAASSPASGTSATAAPTPAPGVNNAASPAASGARSTSSAVSAPPAPTTTGAASTPIATNDASSGNAVQAGESQGGSHPVNETASAAAASSGATVPVALSANAPQAQAINPALVPPPPEMQKTSATDTAVANPKHKSKRFPSIAPASKTPATPVQPTETGDDTPPKRLTPSGGYYVECFLREVVTNIRRNPMMSIASISTVMVLALILGLFTVLVVNLDKIAHELANEMQIKVYMADTFPAEEAEAYRQHIMKIEHVTNAIFMPKDEAFKRLRERLGAAISLDDLEKNPLPDAFQVPVDDPKNLDQVAHALGQITAIEKVDYGREEAGKLLALNKVVRLVGFIILILLFASTVLIVSNTIRLTVFARRKEIDIMQLVGAADWFIRWPFILEGVSQGLIGAGLAALAIDFGYRVVVPHFQRSIAFLPVIAPNELMPFVCVGLVLTGCIVGAIGSLISVNRYLKA